MSGPEKVNSDPMVDITLKNANILIVDDKQANIDVLMGLLEINGYTHIQSTTDSRLVVSWYHSFHPDLILLDLMMPHVSGYQVMEQLKDLIPEGTYLPILVLTADMTAEAKQRALSGGARDFLVKPFDLVEAALRIKNLLFARHLHLQLQNQNQILEVEVKKRTLELENVNAELIVARDKAEESARLKTAFLNNISHEIRTPFNGILGFLSLIQEEDLDVIERDSYINIINGCASRLMNTINHIVEISQIQAGQMVISEVETDIHSLASELADLYSKDAEHKGLKFILKNDVPAGLKKIRTDGIKLKSALINLIDNAVKFTKAGYVEFGIRRNAEYLEFSILDTGPGIPENQYLLIFDRFIQLDDSTTRPYEGSGLGLPIAKAQIEMLGGTIWLESEVGKGTIFYVKIPGPASDRV